MTKQSEEKLPRTPSSKAIPGLIANKQRFAASGMTTEFGGHYGTYVVCKHLESLRYSPLLVYSERDCEWFALADSRVRTVWGNAFADRWQHLLKATGLTTREVQEQVTLANIAKGGLELAVLEQLGATKTRADCS